MKRYTYPAEINLEERRAQAAKRRAALVAAGCSTYVMGLRSDLPAIQCLCCGLGSIHAGDIQNKFCGFCDETHAEWRVGP